MLELKDNLKEPIIYNEVKHYSILDVLKTSYEDFKEDDNYDGIAVYRDKNIYLDLPKWNVLCSLYSCVFENIDQINKELDGE